MARMISAPGFFGSYSESPDEVGAMIARLPASRRDQLKRFTAGRSGFAQWTALISATPCAASRDIAVDGASIVSFTGHLTGPVAGVDGPIGSPAEIVRAAYGKWGRGCFTRLNGNFSVAIFDPALPGFIVARDAAGTRPVFYSRANNIIFGSSAMEVLQASGMPVIANPRALYRYLMHGTVSGEEDTLFEGVYELPGAHYLEAVQGRLPSIHPIVRSTGTDPAAERASLAHYSDALRRLLIETVRTQSSGETAGVSLSGGIDSSSILAALRGALGPGEPLHAFSFVHEHPGLPDAWNELPWAELMAKHVRATLHAVRLEASAIPGAMSRIFQHQEFPFSSPVILAQAEVFRVAAENGMQVMLSGHGPDYLFGGGNSHIIARASNLLRRGRFLAVWPYLRGASSYAAASPLRLLVSSVRHAMPVLKRLSGFSGYPAWACKSWFLDREAVRDEEPFFPPVNSMRRLILDQLHHSRLPSGLQWEECNAVANGLDNRLPYLVDQMLTLAGELPAEYLVSNAGETRYVLRQALRGLVPDPILDRPHPVGFAVPALPWLHEQRPWIEGCLRELESLPFYRKTAMTTTWNRLQGTGPAAWTAAYCTWRWITLLEWAKAYNVTFR